jgi:uncharacterized protein YtpQ (UPF0354 family)
MTDWRAQIRKPRLTLQEFQELCAEALAQLLPDAEVKPGPALGQLLITRSNQKSPTVFLGNLWNTCRQEPDSRANEVERFLKIIAARETDNDQKPDVHRIVPMIKDNDYLTLGGDKNRQPTFVHEHFVGDLWIVYAIDQPDRMTTLPESQFQNLGLAREGLKQLAIENLRRILPPIERHGDGPMFMLTAGADYVASLILFDDIWDELRDLVEGDVVAAVPSRDVLMFSGSNSSAGINAMRQSIDRITATGAYVVSTTMLRLRSDGWKVFG